jgi:large subunit ribosomal protein L10
VPNLELKQRQVDELTDQLQRAELTVLADYRGLTVAELSRLRGRLREAGAEFHVAKNTLARRAATRLGYDELVPYLVGPTGLATGKDPAALAKALQEYGRTQRTFALKGAVLGSRILPATEVTRLADLPSRDQLIAQVVGGFQAPIAGIVNVLSGTLRNFVGVIEARRQQLEGQSGA